VNVGIVGAGKVGTTLAMQWTAAGHRTMLSFSRSTERLRLQAERVGSDTQTGTPRQAVAFGDVVVLSTNFWSAEEALLQMGNLRGHIVIDTTNPYRWVNPEERSGGLVRMVDTTMPGTQWLAAKTPGARWVKAFSTLQPNALAASATRPPNQRVAIPFACNDNTARQIVRQLILDSGGLPFDAGSLAHAGLLEIGGPLAMQNDLTLSQAEKILTDCLR
jgi:8-hydroxy-5-deazaflavin:NADPH oxidoreductase